MKLLVYTAAHILKGIVLPAIGKIIPVSFYRNIYSYIIKVLLFFVLIIVNFDIMVRCPMLTITIALNRSNTIKKETRNVSTRH